MPSASSPRCVSSNGSTSQGSICGSTLALMDAGVPIKAPVAGISCGLIQDGDGSFTTFIDIQGVEDFHGEMDFKVAGTKKGITAIQMDLKNDGLTMAIIKNALEITYDARVRDPRPDHAALHLRAARRGQPVCAQDDHHAHRPRASIREVIGKGGSVIQKIVADTGAKVDIDDDGTIHIASANAAACDAAKKCIDDIVFVPEVGKLYYGRVVRLMQFGAFVEIAPGKDGLVHISKLDRKRVEKVEDVVTVGDMIWVKFMEIDEKGRCEPLPQGRPHRDRSPAGRRKGRRAAVIQIPKENQKAASNRRCFFRACGEIGGMVCWMWKS